MIQELASGITRLKKEFQKNYDGQSHIQEVIPARPVNLEMDGSDLARLHEFAKKNPIYHASHEGNIGGTRCIIYEGDANRYWLNSIGHDSSRAPFSPTWIMSAYVLAMACKRHGFQEMVDVGSGDGRIAFCAKILGMRPVSIEIDDALAGLQRQMYAGQDFEIHCSDAMSLDYKSLGLRYPAFVIGGIAQMGGTDLASGVMQRIGPHPEWNGCGWVFTGTHAQKYRPDPKNEAGWGTLISERSLRVLRSISLPTAWTFHEPAETPYVFAVPA